MWTNKLKNDSKQIKNKSFDMKKHLSGVNTFRSNFFYSISIYRNQKFGEKNKVGGKKKKKKKKYTHIGFEKK